MGITLTYKVKNIHDLVQVLKHNYLGATWVH